MKQHSKALMVSLLALIAISSLLAAVRSPIVASADTVSNYPMQSSISWSFVQGTSPTNSYFQIQVAASGTNSSLTPSHLSVSFWITYNGITYYIHGCSLNYSPGQTYSSCSFTAPFIGDGEYVFSATFTNNAGHQVAQSTVDPRIDPDW